MTSANNTPHTSTKIGFIGAGNMASALTGGLISKGSDPKNITLSDINEDQLVIAQNKFKVNITTNSAKLIASHQVIVLSVKPQVMEQVITPLASDILRHKPLIISIAAGITIDKLHTLIGGPSPIVRCMPNTPALVNKGASGLVANENVSDTQRALAEEILGAVGIVKFLEQESEIDAVTALSGSGPAYFFLMMESMIKAGMQLGLSEEDAKALTLNTAAGAAEMALQSDVDITELRRRVTSPGGTTEAAIKAFEKNNFEENVAFAMQQAFERSKALG